MTTATTITDPGAATSAPVSARRRLVPLFVLLAGAAAVFTSVVAVRNLVAAGSRAGSSAATSAAIVPRSPYIEDTWGVQIRSITLLAATGVIDVRYTVLDVGKATRLHADGIVGLPSLRTNDRGTVKPDSVMFHFHSKANEVDGQGYDIIYGNAHGAVHPGSLVTVVMSDGLELADVPVTE